MALIPPIWESGYDLPSSHLPNFPPAHLHSHFHNLTASGADAIATYRFTLDGNGNRKDVTQDVPLGFNLAEAATTFGVSTTGNRIEDDGTNTFTYDDEGQLITAYGNALTFDPEHRLTSIAGSTTCQFRYDGAGNRLEADRDGVITRYIYDASGNLLAEADATNQIQRYYIYGAGLLDLVEPTSTMYCYHFDATGHTVALTDSTRTIVNAYAYTPFGTIANQQESVVQPFKFVGQYGVMVEDNGWYYMRARYYDPAVGRFISEDPLGFDGGDVNLYVYVQNNPVMFIDPNGEFLQSIVAGGVAGGVVGGITFITELAKGASLSEAGKTAFISGVTTGVGVGLASTGAGFLIANSVASAVNAGLQATINGEVDAVSVLSSFVTTAGGFVSASALKTLTQTSVKGAVKSGFASGLITSPLSVGSNAIPSLK